MSILKFAGENKDFLKGIINRKVKTYDSSKNRINVAGMYLDGVTSASLSSLTKTNSEIGVDSQYHATYDTFTTQTLTVTLLPETYCYQKLIELEWNCYKNQAQFTLTIEDNGVTVDVYRASIAAFSDLNMSNEADDKTVVFNVTPKRITRSNIRIEALDQPIIDQTNTPLNIQQELLNP